MCAWTAWLVDHRFHAQEWYSEHSSSSSSRNSSSPSGSGSWYWYNGRAVVVTGSHLPWLWTICQKGTVLAQVDIRLCSCCMSKSVLQQSRRTIVHHQSAKSGLLQFPRKGIPERCGHEPFLEGPSVLYSTPNKTLWWPRVLQHASTAQNKHHCPATSAPPCDQKNPSAPTVGGGLACSTIKHRVFCSDRPSTRCPKEGQSSCMGIPNEDYSSLKGTKRLG